MKKLVLFIHGLGGDADSTWGKFPELIRADGALSKLYDVEKAAYDTGFIGSQPSLAQCAQILKTEIDNHYPAYADIALIAHSQGGLIARAYIAERLNSRQKLRVSRLLTFATPHHGSGHATLFKRVLFSNQQVKDLDPNSEFLRELSIAWGQAKAERYVRTQYAVAANDAIVGQVSALGQWNPDYEVIRGVGHVASVKPESASDISFLVAKNFLLEEPLLPGGVEADYRAPHLRLNYIEAKETTRFIYAARVLPFIGRDAEIEKLSDFLGGPEQPFRWMVLHGSGGVGKSRLALELCLALRNEWHAGFLSQEGDEPDWGRWQPLVPTLIVVDYAARDPGRTGKLLRALSGRGPADGTMRLSAPVRVLLIERMGKGDWFDKIVGTGTDKARVESTHAKDAADSPIDLPLSALSDPWPIFRFVLEQAEKPLPDKTETLAALETIDPERRPLFAYFMADTIAVCRDIRHFDSARLLDDVINRARDKFWKPAGATPEEEGLLALATMTAGLPVAALKSVPEELSLPSSWKIHRHPAIFRAMTGRASGENIAPLEPDIVGEHFALGWLANEDLSETYRARFCDLAWRLNPLGMAQFMLLCHRDLPNHIVLHVVRKTPHFEGVWQLIWAMASVDLMNDLSPRDLKAARALLADMRAVAQERGGPALWELWASAAYNLIYDLPSRDPGTARELLADMRAVAQQRGEPALWQKWANTAYNLMVDLPSRDPDAARDLLADMRAVAQQRGEAALWEEWAKAAFSLIYYLRSRDPEATRTLLKDMRAVAKERGEPALWEQWAKAAFGLIDDLWSCDPDAARTLLKDMRAVAQERGEPALWEQWAKAAVNLMFDIRSSEPAAARTLLADMRAAAQERGEPALWERWANAASNLMNDLPSRDPEAARALLADMRAVAQERGEPALWEQWGTAAFNLIYDLPSREPAAARAILADMRAVAQERGERALWEVWANAAVNLIYYLRSRDPEATRTLLKDMRAVAQERGEPALWEQWAKAAFSLICDLRSRDPGAARPLLADMRIAAQERGEPAMWDQWAQAAVNLMVDLYSLEPAAAQILLADMRAAAQERGEPTPWKWWAKAAFNLMVDLPSRDSDAARILLKDVRAVAQERGEPALWEEWAKAAVNLINDLRSRDPDAARALLKDMRLVAQERGEPPPWEEWAKAAFNLMIDLPSRDPDAARALLKDMRAVAQERGEPALWEWWAKAAIKLTNDLRSRDPKLARAFLEELSADDHKRLALAIAQLRGQSPQS